LLFAAEAKFDEAKEEDLAAPPDGDLGPRVSSGGEPMLKMNIMDR
jgi:hypothetical protein